MKYLKQFLLILSVSFLGEGMKMLLPFPIPASIYGMALMFLGLVTGLIRLSAVKETARFLIAVMPVMFIPAGVGLITCYDTLCPVLLPVAVVMVVSLVTVMAAAGRVSQRIIRRKDGSRHE